MAVGRKSVEEFQLKTEEALAKALGFLMVTGLLLASSVSIGMGNMLIGDTGGDRGGHFGNPVLPLDSPSNSIHKVYDAWNTSRSGLPTSLTGQSPGPDGIEGTSDDYFEVVGIQNTGLDIGQTDKGHPDFYMGPHGSRVISFTDRTADSVPDGYVAGYAWGTHLAGVVIGNGFSWEHNNGLNTSDDNWDWTEAGVVPEGKVVFDGIQELGGGLMPSPSFWIDEYNLGANTHLAAWFGASGSDYGPDSWAIDFFIDQRNDALITAPAGDSGPGPNTLAEVSQSKNGLTLGASQNLRLGIPDATDPELVFENSSRGGASQSYGRLKPDLLAVGTSVMSVLSCGEWQYNDDHGIPNPRPDYVLGVDEYNCSSGALGQDGIPDYRFLSTTAVSAAMAAGLNMLTREYLRENYGIDNRTLIHSQLTKALLINGAVRMNSTLYDYPGYDQGWGRIDLESSLFPNPPKKTLFEEGNLTSTGVWTPSSIDVNISSPSIPLKVTLVWIDSAGKALSRDLNLKMTSPSGIEYRGNVYGTAGPYDGWSIPNPQVSDANPLWDRIGPDGWDDVNNVEQVEVQKPETGAWKIEVIGFDIPEETNFAIVVSGGFERFLPPTNLTTAAIGDDVYMDWDGSLSTSVDYYLIYRSDDQREFDFSNPVYNTSQDSEPLRTNWTDEDAAKATSPTEYYYVVRAVSSFGMKSTTTNTAGKWTRSFLKGPNAFSLPLEPFVNANVSWYSENIPGTEFVRWMNATGHWVTHYPSMGEGVNDIPAIMGDSFEIYLSSSVNFTFCGYPASMIRFQEGLGDSPAFGKSLSIQVEGYDVNLSWEAVNDANSYLVFKSGERYGLHNLSLLPIASTMETYWVDSGVIGNGRSEYYYMVIPTDSPGGLGSSSYSVGVFTEEYRSGTDAFALPLKPAKPHSLDSYCDNIPYVAGIIHMMEGYWKLHAREMPEGVYDVEAVQCEGYQISFKSAVTRFTFIGY